MTAILRRALVLVLLALVPISARAATTHVVRSGETLSQIASRYYGAAWKWSYLAEANHLDDGKVSPGKRLRIPVVWTYTIRSGDTLALLARRFLKDARRHPFLARFNGIKDVTSLSPGQKILVPFQLHHRVQKGETLASIARRFYHSAHMAHLLRDYDFLTSAHVAPGTVLVVPILDKAAALGAVRARVAAWRKAEAAKVAAEKRAAAAAAAKRAAAKKAAEAARKAAAARKAEEARKAAAAKKAEEARKAAAAKKAEEARKAAEAAKKAAAKKATHGAAHGAAAKPHGPAPLARADALYEAGRYRDTVVAVDRVLGGGTDLPPAAEAHARRLLGFALVALGRSGEAVDQFRRMLAAWPTATLDPRLTSPKILTVFSRARAAGPVKSTKGGRLPAPGARATTGP